MDEDHNAPPLNPLPPVVWFLSLPILAVEVMFQLAERGIIGGPGGVGWRLGAMQDYAFSDLVFEWMLANGQFPPEHVARIVSYAFVHAGFTHALFVVVFVLALGKLVGEIFSFGAVLAVFWAGIVVGALAYGVILDDRAPLIGAFPGAYALIGAFTFVRWVQLGHVGANQMSAFTLIGFLVGIQLLFKVLFGGGNDWVADIAGFGAGFALSFVVSPGGWSRVVAKLRQR